MDSTVFSQRGIRRATAETYLATFSSADVASFKTKQVHNRDSASWKKASHIVLDPPGLATDRDSVLLGWKRIIATDPTEDNLQCLYFTCDGVIYDLYDADVCKRATGTFSDVINAGIRLIESERKHLEVYKLFSDWQDKLPATRGTGLFDKAMAKAYRKALRSKMKDSFFDVISVKNLFELVDKTEFDAIDMQIRAIPQFSSYNEEYRNGLLSAALAQYGKFLAEVDVKAKLGRMVMVSQRISYGAPGTGKSKGLNDTALGMPKENVIRATFHPDSDYSTFVGAYKPKMDVVPLTRIDGDEIKKVTKGDSSLLTEKRISYAFVPQAFAKAYVQAWKKMATPEADGKVAPVMLVIEEINRGDCAKIFGDLFQLLDRFKTDDPDDPTKKAGFSEYPVLADSDLADYVRRELDAVKGAAVFTNYPSVIAADNLELMLPPNMYIWATMNTSDQSLFPMDSAFKRRWDWKYVPIEDKGKDWKIKVGADEYKWWSFLTQINDKIAEHTSSEDKQLGYFFAQPGNGGTVIDTETFVSKVIFYLWKDVFRDDLPQEEPFKYNFKKGKDEVNREIRFTDFYQAALRDKLVSHFLEKLGVEKVAPQQPSNAEVTTPAENGDTQAAVSETKTVAAQTEAVAAATETVAAQTEAVAPGTETVAAQTETVAPGTETATGTSSN